MSAQIERELKTADWRKLVHYYYMMEKPYYVAIICSSLNLLFHLNIKYNVCISNDLMVSPFINQRNTNRTRKPWIRIRRTRRLRIRTEQNKNKWTRKINKKKEQKQDQDQQEQNWKGEFRYEMFFLWLNVRLGFCSCPDQYKNSFTHKPRN